MSRRPATVVCAACGASHAKWSGRCDACGAWNSIAEDAGLADGPARSLGGARGRRVPLGDLATPEPEPPRGPSAAETALQSLDPDALTPREALEALYRLKTLI